MLRLFVVVAVVVAAAADHHSGHCDLLDRLKVKQQWTQAYGFAEDRMAIGTALWRAILDQHPASIAQFFQRVNGEDITSPKFQAHIARVFGGFDMAVSLLDDEATLNAELAHLAEQHKERGITGEYFTTFRQALMTVVEAVLGRCFDREAWEGCTEVITDAISGH